MKQCYAALLAPWLAACQPAEQDFETPKTGDTPGPAPASQGLCEAAATPIAEVQGSGFSSPLAGEAVTIRGVVTLADSGGVLFIQDAQPFSPQGASHGILIASPDLAAQSSQGELLTVAGVIGEIGKSDDTITAVVEVHGQEHCGAGPEPPVFDARLPLNPEEREAFEAMRLLLEQPLTVSAVRDVSEGQISVSALGLLRAPTEVAPPGPEAIAQERKNRDWSLPIRNDALRDLEPYTKVHAGALVNVLNGVLGHDGRQLTLVAEGDLAPVAQPVPAVPEAPAGAIRVAAFNLYEYFNGDGEGGGFPGERGARSQAEFAQQAARIAAAVAEIRPDILAVMELENDGFGPLSAVQRLRRSLSEKLGVEFQVAAPEADRAGSDVIAVGLLYRPDRLLVHGPARLLEGGSFGPLNRAPLAQLFAERVSGERFLVVSNHLKSKSYCPESGPDADQGDGQACWNPTRVEGAGETLRWARQLAAEADTEQLLLMGDFNAYRLEDPVRALLEEGLTELVEHHNPGLPQYSYIYRGAAGTLDYAFASDLLAGLSANAFIWHINAAYPYSARPTEPWLRSSDHDPVVVDLLFTQSATAD